MKEIIIKCVIVGYYHKTITLKDRLLRFRAGFIGKMIYQ